MAKENRSKAVLFLEAVLEAPFGAQASGLLPIDRRLGRHSFLGGPED